MAKKSKTWAVVVLVVAGLWLVSRNDDSGSRQPTVDRTSVTSPTPSDRFSATPPRQTAAVDPQADSRPSRRTLYTTTRANVRRGPSDKTPVVAALHPGAPVVELSTLADWTEISDGADRRLGWIATRLLSSTPGGKPERPTEDRPATETPTRASPPKPAAPPALSHATIVARIISESRGSYSGSCGCPDDRDRAGRRRGGRSAYSRAGGASVVCYPNDVTPAMIQQFQASR